MEKQGHKYVKRTGFPGNYVYWYKMPDGSVRPGDESQQRLGKKDHAHRLVASAGDHGMDHKTISKETGLDESHIKNLHTNQKSHKKQGRDGHEFDKNHLREASMDTVDTRKEKLQAEIAQRSAKKVDTDKKMESLQNSIKNIKDSIKKQTIRNEGGPISKELLEKVKKMGKGQGREVNLDKDELETLLSNGVFALVSAGKNPKLEPDMDDKAQKERHEKMKEDLVGGGYAFTKVTGHYEGSEDSFLVMVHDADKEDIAKMGNQYNQDSVIYAQNGKQQMIYTAGENEGQHHKGEGWEETPDASDYYTEFKHPDGSITKFSLNFNFDELNKAFRLVVGLGLDLFKSEVRDLKEEKISLIKSILEKRSELRKAAPNK